MSGLMGYEGRHIEVVTLVNPAASQGSKELVVYFDVSSFLGNE